MEGHGDLQSGVAPLSSSLAGSPTSRVSLVVTRWSAVTLGAVQTALVAGWNALLAERQSLGRQSTDDLLPRRLPGLPPLTPCPPLLASAE